MRDDLLRGFIVQGAEYSSMNDRQNARGYPQRRKVANRGRENRLLQPSRKQRDWFAAILNEDYEGTINVAPQATHELVLGKVIIDMILPCLPRILHSRKLEEGCD
jgi:hypothetical protein